MVSDTTTCVFISYRPEDDTLHHSNLTADKKMQGEMVEAANKFWEANVIGMKAPELSDKDVVTVSTPEFKKLEQEYVTLLEAKAATDLILKSAKERLIKACGSHARSKGELLKITKSERKGSVDYKKVPELTGIDLEQYRKKSSEVVTITAIKRDS